MRLCVDIHWFPFRWKCFRRTINSRLILWLSPANCYTTLCKTDDVVNWRVQGKAADVWVSFHNYYTALVRYRIEEILDLFLPTKRKKKPRVTFDKIRRWRKTKWWNHYFIIYRIETWFRKWNFNILRFRIEYYFIILRKFAPIFNLKPT